jgi:YVTN family beta-propeller protein
MWQIVANRVSNTLSMIDTATNTVVATVDGVATFPEAVVINDNISSGGCG